MKVNLMKTCQLIIVFFVFLLFSFVVTKHENRRISGIIVNEKSEPVGGAFIFSENTRKGTISNAEGQFEFIIPSGIENIAVEVWGFKNKIIPLGADSFYNITLEKSKDIDVSLTDLAKMRERESTIMDLKSDGSIRPAPTSAAPKTMKSEFIDADYSMSESRIGKEYADSGIHDSRKMSSDKESKDSKTKESAGQLTAGEWNDLKNWNDWNQLINEADYKEMAEYWLIRPSERISVYVSNQYELPIPDCVVTLKAGNKMVWTGRTDNAGKAELWLNEEQNNLSLEVVSKENKFQTPNVKRIKDGTNHVRFNEECNAPLTAEIMFVVDATGSMGDEIEFLKSEISDVIEQVSKDRSSINFRWGSVFYRDNSDDYLTRQSPLSGSKEKIAEFINMQSADGGGDYPEAVNEGLEEALMQDWSDNAIARIVFLILDAPPHHTPEVMSELQSQIEYAASMGIKIVPITASGINRQTEYLMKFMSIMTNGTYVFLTDDSGIGNAHLDPIVKDFEVEKLNDLVIRLIKNYSNPGTCTTQKDNDPLFEQVEIFPNPATDYIQVKVPEGVEKITVTTNSGQIIFSQKITDQRELTINLSGFVDGLYLLNYYSSNNMHSFKVIKSNRA